jgi:TetR/AcrR family transcriptional regulator, transcriptional repressor for nem operon
VLEPCRFHASQVIIKLNLLQNECKIKGAEGPLHLDSPIIRYIPTRFFLDFARRPVYYCHMPIRHTRSSILEKGARIIHKKGYNHTGIKEILDAAGVPKGSFYHFFKSKEDFGLNLLDHYAGFFVKKSGDLLKKTDTPPLQRLKGFFDGFRCFFEDNACELGCPIGNLSQEMGDLNPAFRKKLEEIFQLLAAPVEKLLNEAQERDELSKSADTRELADFIINSWEGAILRMKVQKNPDALRLFDKMIFDGFLKQ